MVNKKHEKVRRPTLIWHRLRIPRQSVRFAVMFVCLLLFAKLVEKNILFPSFDDRHAGRIQKIFTEKERTLLRNMDILEQYDQKNTNSNSSFIDFHEKYADNLKKRGLYFFIYRNDTLTYWSTNDVAVPETYSSSEFDKPYVSLGNNLHASGKFASFVRIGDGYAIVGLALLKNVYINENKYLKTAFQNDFGLPANVKIYPEQMADYYPITDSNKQFVWSLFFDSTCFYKYQIYLPALAYLLAFIILLILLDSIFGMLRTPASKNLYLLALALILAGIRLVTQHWQIPAGFYELDIFKPEYFGLEWFPSLGELFLWCIFISFFVIELYRFLKFPVLYKRRWKYFAYIGISLASVIVGFFTICILLKTSVINSIDVFEEPNRMLLLNGISLFGYTIILLFLISFCLVLDKAVLLCKQELTFYQFLIVFIIILSLVMIAWRIIGLHINLPSVFFLFVLVFLTGNLRLKKTVKLKYSHFILLVFVLALFTSVNINKYSFEKKEDQKKLLVTNLSSQHDLTAEFFFRNISEQIISDTVVLRDNVYKAFQLGDNSNLLNYIKRQYFYYSYWNRYLFRCRVHDDTQEILITRTQRWENFVQYISRMTNEMGTQLSRSQFWYIDRPNEISWYLGWFRKEKEGEAPLHLFIELWPDGALDEVGYPELLLNDRLVKDNNLKGYSYAKYMNNRIITQYGTYKYNLNGDIFQTEPSDYHTVYYDDMEHLVYRSDEKNMMVLSSNSPKMSDLIVNFSCIFIFFFTVVSLCLICYLPAIRRGFRWNFRNKIQYSLIVVMMISFAILGGFTVLLVNRQYQKKNNDIVKEKIKAIHKELSDAIIFQKKLDKEEENKEMLTGLLSDYQRIFFTDINLFDVRGQLIATSLPDVFDRGMMGRQINPNAYKKLYFGQRASIIEHEDIGGLHYLSAYEPFLDDDSQVIGFLNLPYFTQQGALTEEISNVITTLLNFYMLIILFAVIVSVIMSNQITQPLMMLQEKFRNIRLGEKNDPIRYESRDEVGGLVKEYNRAIEELARSAARLARSERESAWREMAKQIAHEINNPLTPMKLSVQHLKRAYDNQSERFDEYMEKIPRSLVEQIDTLSAIATEFSNFAKMPVAHNERIDLIEQINNVVPLFAIDENKRAFQTDFHGLEHAVVSADKEQMSRVFINLFKNALQAIPKSRQAEIHIDVLKINQKIWIRIKDNGMGIPEEMQGKIFRQNFSTKSSGMGLGLSIVHRIIESVGGTINFKTQKGKGTTFIISLPATE